jgi:hypothetical protein
MCPSNTTNLEDGSSGCPTALQPGTNTSARYAVIVSFGVYLNGTSLDDIAQKVSNLYLRQMSFIVVLHICL